jgi:hypothetical protein
MSEHEPIDALLRHSLAAPVPRLSPAFDRKLQRRLRPRRLTPVGRGLLIAYVLMALLAAVWVMRRAEVDWPYVGASLALAFGIAAAAQFATSWVRESSRTGR